MLYIKLVNKMIILIGLTKSNNNSSVHMYYIPKINNFSEI